MSADEMNNGNTPTDDWGSRNSPAPGAALEKRSSAVVATRPGSRPDRSRRISIRGRRVVYATVGRGACRALTSRSIARGRSGGWCATLRCTCWSGRGC